MTLRLGLFLVLLWGSGCAPLFSAPPAAGTTVRVAIDGVPFREQVADDDCGPAALASLLAYRGRDLPVPQIASEVYTPSLHGSLLPDLENFARRQGFSTRSGRGDLDLLRRVVAAGRPIMIPVETGLKTISRPHYLVVFGYDSKGFHVHAGVKENVYIEAKALLPRWEKMNRLYLYLD